MPIATGDATAILDETIADGQILTAQNLADANAKINLAYNQSSGGTKSFKTIIVDGVGGQTVAIGGGNVVEVSGGRTKLTGSGANEALLIVGGGTSGPCIVGTAGAPNGTAVVFTGDGSGGGGSFTGGDSSGTALTATGGAPNGVGLVATGTGTGNAITATGNVTCSNETRSKRFRTTGTALVAGDFTIGAGWGATATVTNISGSDTAWIMQVNCSGAGIAADPQLTLTFKDGTFTTAPIPQIQNINGTTLPGDISHVYVAVTATTVAWNWIGTPTSGRAYVFSGIIIGV